MKTIIMKTKNILKIGVFSIVILSLLISPILKSNKVYVNAAEKSTCEDRGGTCTLPTVKCEDLGNGTGLKAFNASTLSCVVEGIDSEKTQCCMPTAAVVGFGANLTFDENRLFEKSAVDICDDAFPNGKSKWGIFTSDSDEVVQHAVCVFQIGIIEGLGEMFNATINWGISMILWAIEPATFGGFVTNKGVTDVGKIIRDFINLFLILGLVFIAIATILGIKKYSWQQTLWKLVVVALLVNFSVIISGMILDVSQFFTYNFLDLAKANNDISVAIKSGFNASSTMDDLTKYSLFGTEAVSVVKTAAVTSGSAYVPAETTVKLKGGWGLSWGNFFITVAGMILIGLFAVIALLAVFVAMIIRACLLIILLCLSPIAFAAWIFPDTEKYWKMWWEQFIKWCTFPVIFSLMLYMGITVMNGLFTGIGSGDAAKLGMIAFGIQMFLFSMFLVAGLLISVQGGGAAAQFVMKQGSKVRSAVVGAVGLGIQRSNAYRAVGQKLTQVPVLNKIGYNMLDQSDRARFTNIRKIEKDMEGRTQGEITGIANGLAPSPMNRDAYAHYMAAVRIATRKGWLKNDSAALGHIRANLNDPNLNIKEVRDAFPQYFRIVKGQLEEITTNANAYMNDLVNHIASLSSEDLSQNHHRERIFEEAKLREVNRAEFIRQLTQRLTSSQQVALYGNIDPETWNNVKEPWGGNGIVAQAVQGTPEEATLNTKIASSRRLEEVLGITPVKATTTPAPTPAPTPALKTPSGNACTWNSTFNCWVFPATGAYNTPDSPPPNPKSYWRTNHGDWAQA